MSKKRKVDESDKFLPGDILRYTLSLSFDNLKQALNLMMVCKEWYQASRHKTFWKKFFIKGLDRYNLDKSLRELIEPFHHFWWGFKDEVESSEALEKTVFAKMTAFVFRYRGTNSQSYIEYDKQNDCKYIQYCSDRMLYGHFDNHAYLHIDTGKNITWVQCCDHPMELTGDIVKGVFQVITNAKIFYSYKNGSLYCGEAKENDETKVQPEGKGKITWDNGDWYEGHFEDHLVFGEGQYYLHCTGEKGYVDLVRNRINPEDKNFFDLIKIKKIN